MNSNTFFTQRLASLLILSSITSLFLVCVTGPFMAMDGMNQQSDCGMAHTTTVCPMMLSGRMSVWQNIIIPISSTLNALALLALLVATAFYWNSARLLDIAKSKLKLDCDVGSPILFNYLFHLFSQGILQPKIY